MPKHVRKIWCNNIQKLCDSKGISRYRLSKDATAMLKQQNPTGPGLSQQYLLRLVKEEVGAPSFDVMRAAAAVLGVKVDDLTDWTRYENQKAEE